MSDKPEQKGNLRGIKINPPGPATWISHAWRMFIGEILTCLMNPRISILTDAGDGAVATRKDFSIVMGSNGWVAEINLAQLSSGGGSGGSATRYRIKDDFGASLKCRTWDGTTQGSTDIFIAKPTDIRNTIASDVKNGITYTLTYVLGSADSNGNHYLARTVAGSDGSAETDDIVPPYLFNSEIYAIAIASQTLDGNACTMMDTNVDGRAWAFR